MNNDSSKVAGDDLSLAIVILAAGGARRFGAIKQLAEYQGKPLLQHAIDASLNTSAQRVHVVLGASADSIAPAIDNVAINIIRNHSWDDGVAGSIKQSVSALGRDYQALMFLAADQIKVGALQLQNLIDAWQAQPDVIVAAAYADEFGIPAIFPRFFYPQLMQLTGDKGGKKVLMENSDKRILVAMPEAQIDVDCPADLAAVIDGNIEENK